MRKKALFAVVATIAILVAPGWPAAEVLRTRDVPRRYSEAARDDVPVVASLDSGAAWSAWSYRISGEYAIALSFRPPNGSWGDPSFIGVDDRLDQIDPDIVADANGSLYLAYAVLETGTIHVSALHAGRQAWFEPQQVTLPTEQAGKPSLGVVGDRLVLAYLVGDDIRLLDWPLLPAVPEGFTTEGIQEGPDGFPLSTRNDQDPRDINLDPEQDETQDDNSSGRADRMGQR